MAKSRVGGKYTKFKYFSSPEKNTPEYKLWRLQVYKRDKFMCRKCGKKMTKGRHLQAHHIYKWADYPLKRFDVGNGITLCWECHKSLYGSENAYISLCLMLIGNVDSYIKMKQMLHDEKEKEEKELENGEENV